MYLGLAIMVFYPKLEEECGKDGIQAGDTIIINDDHLKVF